MKNIALIVLLSVFSFSLAEAQPFNSFKIIAHNGLGGIHYLDTGSSGQVLVSGGKNGDPSWKTSGRIVSDYFGAPHTASATSVHAAVLLTTVKDTITTAITNPDVPRVLALRGISDSAAGSNSWTIYLKGTNILGSIIYDTVVTVDDGSSTLSNKAFKTVTRVILPVRSHATHDSISVGCGDGFGILNALPRNTILKYFEDDNPTAMLFTTFNFDAVFIEKNIFTTASASNGSKTFRLDYYIP